MINLYIQDVKKSKYKIYCGYYSFSIFNNREESKYFLKKILHQY